LQPSIFKKIAIAHDGSDGARKAFDCAVELASCFHAELHMISVEENLPQHAQTMLEVDHAKDTAMEIPVGSGSRQDERNGSSASPSLTCPTSGKRFSS
jgi:hypothetical protein